MKIFIIVSIILKITFVYSQDISYIRYYANEKDFMANVPMKASDRRGYDHMAAYFNDRNLPVQVEYYLSNGSLNKREVMEYNKEKELVRRGEVNSKGKYIKLIVYSNNEPWSREYQKWNYSGKERFNFTEQRSIFQSPEESRSLKLFSRQLMVYNMARLSWTMIIWAFYQRKDGESFHLVKLSENLIINLICYLM